MNIKIFVFALACMYLAACEPTIKPALVATPDHAFSYNSIHTDSSEAVYVVVSTPQAILRHLPALTASEVARLQKEDTLLYLNELTKETTKMRLGNTDYDEPFLKVASKQGGEGWIYGGNVRFINLTNEELSELVLDRRLRAMFGGDWAEQLGIYRDELHRLQTEVAFGMMWQRGEQLSDDLEKIINKMVANQGVNDNLPDFLWLNQVMEGYLVHWIAEQQRFYLFRDLRYWLQKTTQTSSLADEQFMQTYLLAYASDSIEYWYPDWQFRKNASDTTICSLLGRGVHVQILDSVEVNLQRSVLFRTELLRLKKSILMDILESKHYWLPTAAVVDELRHILQKNYTCVSRPDRIALEARIAILENAAANGIATNEIEN